MGGGQKTIAKGIFGPKASHTKPNQQFIYDSRSCLMSDKKCLDTIAVGQLTGTGHYTKYGGGEEGRKM